MYGVMATGLDKVVIGFYLFSDEGVMTRALMHPGRTSFESCRFTKVTPKRPGQGFQDLIEFFVSRGFTEEKPYLVKTFGLVPVPEVA